MLPWIIICLSLSLIASSAPVDCSVENSAFIYINPTGNDTTNSGNFSSPYQTLSKALEKVSSTQFTICVQQGSYNETMRGAVAANLTVSVVGVNNPTLHYLEVYGSDSGSLEFFDLTLNNLQSIHIVKSFLFSNVQLKNANAVADSVSVQSCKVNSVGGDKITLTTSSNCFINDTTVSGSKGTTADAGVIEIYGKNVNVSNSLFTDNTAGISGALFINATKDVKQLMVSLNNVNFTDNRALGNHFGLGLASAIFVYQPSGTVANVTLTGVVATCYEQSLIGFNVKGVNYDFIGTDWNHCTTSCKPGQFHKEDYIACILCPAGEYNNITNARACETCHDGSVSAQGATECKNCTAGNYANKALQECLLCPPGTYSDRNIIGNNCTLCPIGEFNPELGQTSCIKCSDGQYTDAKGAYECQGLTYLSWALIAVGIVVFLLILGFWIGYRIFTNRKHAYQAIE